MGAFANHGVEYHVVYKSGKRRVIAPMKVTHDRLLVSKYYEKHRDMWWSPEIMYGKGAFVEAIENPDFDVELTKLEQMCLALDLQDKASDVNVHGWYEVNTIESTLSLGKTNYGEVILKHPQALEHPSTINCTTYLY